MLLHIGLVLAGLALLPIGAEWLVRGSTGIALRLGVTALAIGLTVVAFGTGSPELVLSIQASAAGNGGIALGNVVGSNISNIALVLGLAALVRPLKVRSQLVRREVPIMIAVTVMLGALLLDGSLGRLDGLLLLFGAVVYNGPCVSRGRKHRVGRGRRGLRGSLCRADAIAGVGCGPRAHRTPGSARGRAVAPHGCGVHRR